jgi:Zn-finger nucleic acid-binding protein
MKCPKCDTLMNEITRAGVLVDVCPRCLGMWLDRGELEKISGRLREIERDWDDDERYGRGREPVLRHDEDDPRRYPKRKRWTELFDIFD